MHDQHPPARDEDVLVIPDSWRPHLHPRRGGLPGPATEVDDAAAKIVRGPLREAQPHIEAVLAAVDDEQELVRSVREAMEGEANPLGAAAVAAIVSRTTAARSSDWQGQVVDSWVADHGVAFAACAIAELGRVVVEPDGEPRVRLVPAGESFPRPWSWDQAVRRVRSLLATTTDRDYQDAVDRLAECRGIRMQRVVVSYLVPTRQDWVDECGAMPPGGAHETAAQWMLWCALGTAEQVRRMESRTPLTPNECSLDVLATVCEGVGVAIAPAVERALRKYHGDGREALLEVFSALPTDRAFRWMLNSLDDEHVRPALLSAMRRFPVRALRLLAPSAGRSRITSQAAELTVDHLRAHPELASMRGLPNEVREVVQRLSDVKERVEEAPAEALPRSLVEPPWTRTDPAAKPVVLKGLTPPGERELVWQPGERETWLDNAPRQVQEEESTQGHGQRARDYRAHRIHQLAELELFARGWDDLVRPLLADWSPDLRSLIRSGHHNVYILKMLKALPARFGQDVWSAVFDVARANVDVAGSVLLPFRDVETARLMADWLVRRKSARDTAVAWLVRHGPAAARLLTPDALGRAATRRRNAVAALRLIADKRGTVAVVEAARSYGDEATQAVETVLAGPPEAKPPVVPRPPDWAVPGLLPQILLKGRGRALPAQATRHVITMAMMAHEELETVRELCDRRSLAEFGWALFETDEMRSSRGSWALTALGRLGDDETVRRLDPLIRAWPGQNASAKAMHGLDVLAEIGSETALTHLNGIALNAKSKGVRSHAQDRMDKVADGLGLTREQLADRVVPDFGLDADGGLTLDYGPRRFVVGFDERLRPYVRDEDGKRRKALPKPGVKDDPELAPAAHERFARLKKDVRTSAVDQIQRLENAMAARRRWTPAELRDLFIGHPLMWHIVRRLLWVGEDGDSATAFRIAEDRTFADINDDALTLPDGARIGIVHPVELGDAVGTWSQVFADYEILQPFPQLHRPVHTLTNAERESGSLERFEGLSVPFGAVLALVRRGWQRGAPQDAGLEFWISREVPGGLHVVIDLDPGIQVGRVDLFPEQKLGQVWLGDHPASHATPRAFGELDSVTASEVLSELTELAETAS